MKITISLIAFITGIAFSDIIENILSEQLQFISIFLVVILDLIFGAAKAFNQKNFKTSKSMKSVFMLVAFWSLLSVVLVIEMTYEYMSFLSEAILLPIILLEIISILKNMHVLGLLTGEALGRILKNIDKHKE